MWDPPRPTRGGVLEGSAPSEPFLRNGHASADGDRGLASDHPAAAVQGAAPQRRPAHPKNGRAPAAALQFTGSARDDVLEGSAPSLPLLFPKNGRAPAGGGVPDYGSPAATLQPTAWRQTAFGFGFGLADMRAAPIARPIPGGYLELDRKGDLS